MWSFRAYLKDKCADPEFLEQYHEQCTVCPQTVLIISTIRDQGLSMGDVARRAGVEQERLELLESADHCVFEDVQKLCRCLDLPVPGGCRKGERKRKNSGRSGS